MVAEHPVSVSDLQKAADTERHLLAACFRSCEYDGSGLDDVAAVVSPGDFSALAHQLVFGAMLELRARSAPVTVHGVFVYLRERNQLAELGSNPAVWLADLYEAEPTDAAARYYANVVKEHSGFRALKRVASQIVAETQHPTGSVAEIAGRCERLLLDATGDTATAGPRSVAELIANELADIDNRRERGPEGVPTGFREVDRLLSGMRPGQLVVIGARPAVGKTSFALGIAANATAAGTGVLFCSLEMTNAELTQRLLSASSGVRLRNIRESDINPEQAGKLVDVGERIAKWPLKLEDCPNLTADRLAATARRAVRRNGVQLLIVDYLQLLTPDNQRENRNAQIGLLARRLKLLARELSIPVIVLCQLNRESENRADPKPRLSDLRDSGEIEQHADCVLLLSPQRGPADGARTLIDCGVAKNRNGPTGEVTLAFTGPLTRYENA